MKTYNIDSNFHVSVALPEFTQEQIKNEPMLFNCSIDAGYDLGGPITKSFIDAAGGKKHIGKAIIDTRIHMLMPGWYPCIPGWHHDDVPRSRSDGQPNYDTPEYNAKHVMALINGDICPTQFAVGKCEMPEVPLGETIYKVWHKEVEYFIEQNVLEVIEVPQNKLVWFNNHSFHQGQKAKKSGWRWFGRITFDSHRKPTNEIRQQVQVYLENPMEGW